MEAAGEVRCAMTDQGVPAENAFRGEPGCYDELMRRRFECAARPLWGVRPAGGTADHKKRWSAPPDQDWR